MWPIAVPVVSSEHDVIKDIFYKKKIWETSALRAAKLKQEQQINRANNDNPKKREQIEKKIRENSTTKANEARHELNELFLRQSEIEKSVQCQWEEKIRDFENRSLQDAEDGMSTLRQEHDREMKQLTEKARVEHENDKEKKFAVTSNETTTGKAGGKRKAESRESRESGNKRLKVENSTANVQGKEDASDVGKEDVLGSVEKERELEKTVDEMSCLNKTKSQMIWLLKQVITAETKLKMKLKR